MKELPTGKYRIVFTITFGGESTRRVIKDVRSVIQTALKALTLVVPIASIVGRIEKEDDDA